MMTESYEVNGGYPSSQCPHPYIRKGYYLGLSPDVYVCMRCGEQRRREHWEAFERRRMPPAGLLNVSDATVSRG
ncbi:hypothetical protein QFZ45_003454 [Pseudomonas synxantha]|nr:hypothetical protein [Pseudomonas synxantha]